MPAERPDTGADEGRSTRWGQLLTILGLTGFAISQPILAVAGENPSMFTFAGMAGTDLVLFALVVAFVPPIVLWTGVQLVGRVHRRAGDVAFTVVAATLAGAAVGQWAWSAGLDRRPARLIVWLAAAAGFALLLTRVRVVAMWTRYTGFLPVLAVATLLLASPSSALLASPEEAPRPTASELPSVVFVMLDEFPLVSILDDDGGIDAVRFPNLAALAEASTWYPDYTVVATSTERSVPSILSGRLPTGDPPLWTSHPDNLFSLLAPTHDLVVSESVTRLCGFTDCMLEGSSPNEQQGTRSVVGQMADVWLERVGLAPSSGPDLGQFADELQRLDPEEVDESAQPDVHDVQARPVQASAFLDAIAAAPEPTLGYLHLMLPHQPWAVGPDGRPWRGLTFPRDMELDEWTFGIAQQSHLFQAQYADRLVGEIVEHLRAEDRYDDTLLVVTADHGIGFEQLPMRTLTDSTVDDLAYVPLFIKAPGQHDGEIDRSNLMSIDLLPTIAASIGVELPFEVDGHAAGTAGIAERGGSKVILDFTDGTFGGSRTPTQRIEFTVDEHRPDAADRTVGSAAAGAHPLAGLLRSIGAEGWLGTDVAELEQVGPAGSATLPRHELLSTDSPEGAEIGMLSGQVLSPSTGQFVLLTVDGVVESAAPVGPDGRFHILVAPDTPRGPGVEVGAFLVEGDRVIELILD